MLVQAIPAYRLPRDELRREIGAIQKLGVEIKLKRRLGRDFTLTSLREKGAEAVFLAVGAPKGTGLGLKGEDAKNVVEAIEYLRTYNLTGNAPRGRRCSGPPTDRSWWSAAATRRWMRRARHCGWALPG